MKHCKKYFDEEFCTKTHNFEILALVQEVK